MVTTERAAEAKVRRAAARLNLEVRKSRARLGGIDNLGGFMIVNPSNNSLVAGARYEFSAQDVALWLADIADGEKLPKLAESMRALAAEEIEEKDTRK
jgi:hypothetical protein